MPSLSYCAELTRTYDRPRYIAALFAPADIREAWFTLFAFQHEIASIADKVSEEMVGFIRYAWWRETVEAIYNDMPPRGHPLAEAMALIVKRFSLPKESFEAVINAYENAMAEKHELDETFMQATAQPMMQLMAHAAGVSPCAQLDALGIAWAAIEAAALPHMDNQHRKHFLFFARAYSVQVNNLYPVFMPFAHTMAFYLKRLERGKNFLSYPLLIISLCSHTLWSAVSGRKCLYF